MSEDLAQYLKDRNEMLSAPFSVDAVKRFAAKYDQKLHLTDKGIEAGFHQARTAVQSLDMKLRRESKQWLVERGYRPLDDGDV